jgi:hypothetical protein
VISFSGGPVPVSPDLVRIRNLPDRRATFPEVEDLRLNPQVSARPIQDRMMREAVACRGLFAAVGVGHGKTIPSLLIPTLLGAKRPVLLIPAALRTKTENERIRLSKDWRVSLSTEIISYQELGRVGAAGRLEMRNPDVIVADEVQKLKHRKAAVTRRVSRHMHAHPETIFIALSGTILEKSLEQFAHIMAWCLKENAPIPLRAEILREWAEALDPKVDPMKRRDAGALLSLSLNAETGADAFRQRLERTEGVVISSDADAFGGSLIVERISYDMKPVTEENFDTLRELAETPDGWALSEAVEISRVAKQLALGICYVWEPRPPDEWRFTRKAWASFVREVLSRSRTLDSELQVLKAVQAGDIDDGGLLEAWLATKPSFEINVVDTWYDDSALVACERWLAAGERSIVWTKHSFFAKALAKRTGLEYFGAKGLNARKELIDDPARPGFATGTNCIASADANGTGRNLQPWNRNLLTCPDSDPGLLEQLIGRTHRPGQQADEVYVDLFWNCREHDSAIEKAITGSQEDALLSGQTKKILLADIVPPGPRGTGARWRI